MSKGKQFWLDSWLQESTPFHKTEVHPDLLSFWPDLAIEPKSTVLVPLCGKSLDLLWLVQQGYQVLGIELSEVAVLQFFKEQQINYDLKVEQGIKRYRAGALNILVGDIFTLDSSLIPPVEAIYDRAALVALPQKLRQPYVHRCLSWLKPKGSLLLNTLSYEFPEIIGPPYSVSPAEVAALYEQLSLECLRVSRKERTLPALKEQLIVVEERVWQLNKEEN